MMPALTAINTALTVIWSFMRILWHIYVYINQLSLWKLSDLKTGMVLIKQTETWICRFSSMKLLSKSQLTALRSLHKNLIDVVETWAGRKGGCIQLQLRRGQVVLFGFRELAHEVQGILSRHLAVLFPLDTGEFDGGHRHCAWGNEPSQHFLWDGAATHAW